MKLYSFLFLLVLCACRSTNSTSDVKSPEARIGVLEAIAQAIDPNYVPKAGPVMLTQQEIAYLKRIKIYDPLILAHPRYYDRVKSIEGHQVERYYLNFNGDVTRSEVITLPDQDFWRPLRLLAQCFSKYGIFPPGSDLSVPLLQGLLAQKTRSPSFHQ